VQIGIVHLERSVASGELERNDLVVPEDLPAADFEAIDGESEELLDGTPAACAAGFSLRKVRAAVRIENNMDYRLLKDDFMEGELGTEKRDDLQAGDDAIGVRERNVSGRLAPMNGYIAHVHLQTEWGGVKAADLGVAPGDPFDFSDQAAPNQSLERFGIDIDPKNESGKKSSASQDEQVLPPAAG
jgi:hypothetical protein